MTVSADAYRDEELRRFRDHPVFRTLVRRRTRFAWTLAAIMMAVHFGFILLVAFAGGWLGTPIGGGPVTVGIPLGLGVVAVAFVVTGLYVRRANTEFDALTHRLFEDMT